MKEIILLEQFILNAPASHEEHQRALKLLSDLVKKYEEKCKNCKQD